MGNRILGWRVFWACLLFGNGAFVRAQQGTGIPFLRVYPPKEYGAQVQNWAVARDHRGRIYVGNLDGVLEYDGVRWRLIPTAKRTLVRSLAADESGRIWVGGFGEFGYLAPDATGTLAFVSLSDGLGPQDQAFDDVMCVVPTSRGIYFQSPQRLFRYSENGLITWRPTTAFHYAFWVRGRFFIVEVDRGLLVEEGGHLRLAPDGDRFAKDRITAMFPWGRPEGQNILIATARRGLFLFDGTSIRPFRTDADFFLRRNRVFCGTTLHGGTVVLGTLLGGAVHLDETGRVIRVLNGRTGLPSETVYALHADPQGILWMALQKGIARVLIPAPFSIFDERTGIKETVCGMARFQGSVYAATSSGVSVLKGIGPVAGTGPAPFQIVPGIEKQSWSFLSAGDDLLLANTEGVFDIREGRARLLRASKGQSLALHRSRTDPSRVYVGLTDGLASLRRSAEAGGSWIDEGKVPGITEMVGTLAESEDGSLWLGTWFQGVLRVRFPGGSRTAAQVERFGTAQGLPSLKYLEVLRGRTDLLFATSQGLYRYDAAQGRFLPDPRFSHLFPDGPRAVGALREDVQGRLWMHTHDEARGLRETGAAVPQADGSWRWERIPFLALGGSIIECIFPEDGGGVWFGGSDGLVRYDPQVSKDYGRAFHALVSRVSVNGGRLLFGGASDGSMPPPTLARWENALRFEFAAPFFDQENATRYQTLLEGYDRQWSSWGAETAREFTNLPPGDYRFRVRARNVYERVSQEGAYAFHIHRPWWMTWWARLLGGVALVVPLAGLIGWAAFRARVRHLVAINAVLRERERLAREIHDGLGHGLSGIASLLNLAQAEAGDAPVGITVERALSLAERTLVDARDAAHALRLIALEGGLRQALLNLCDEVAPGVRVVPLFEGGGRPLPDLLELHLFRIAEEALTNALRHAQAERIELALTQTPRRVRLEIRDDGKGFALASQDARRGMGLQSMRDRASSVGGRLQVTSKSREGTIVRVEVPIPWLWWIRQGLARFRLGLGKPGPE